MQDALEVNQLTVRFGDHLALDQICFNTPTGAFLAIVGPNGAGKSTLIRVLLGLVTPTSGQVQVLGAEAGAYPARIGYVPQIKTFDRSFPAIALELVMSGIHRAWPARLKPNERHLALQALEQVGATEYAHRQLGRLSGGQLQRVYLARALVRQPELIILDEPATGIDAVGEKDMYAMLERYRAQSGATIAMITHDWDVARYHATQVLVLNQKRFGYGTPAEVLSDDCLGRAYGHAQHQHKVRL